MDGPAEQTGAASVLRAAADVLERLAARTTAGRWTASGLLATRPEVIAHHEDGSTEHVAEARAGTANWIVALSPATAPHLVRWLRATADTAAAGDPATTAAVAFAETLLAARTGR
ncbi:hypothetical protein [Pseudonocardia acidicola]|uniref:Uncharacterized protein n=1 Tax=Pseudonocardia acidicola TaxID=2724939 RepID=A0ABX1SGA0_9PSEU|nr:hypothetical protein [Pseudonocardia acidicola]NMH99582.1 hypothetical protein [Pseudonocardia acidicola]